MKKISLTLASTLLCLAVSGPALAQQNCTTVNGVIRCDYTYRNPWNDPTLRELQQQRFQMQQEERQQELKQWQLPARPADNGTYCFPVGNGVMCEPR